MSVPKMPIQAPKPIAKDVSSREQSKGKKTSTEQKKSAQPIVPQFINVTSSVTLDDNARSQVRAQVMRDYHRRRVQKIEGNETSVQEPALELPRPKGHTHKFRFGKEKGLRPWVPVKAPPGSKKHRKPPVRRKKVSTPDEKDETSTVIFKSPGLSSPKISDGIKLSDEALRGTAPADNWLSSLDFAIQTSALFHTPGNGSFDPFAATSLLIKPRTQMLIHHYFNERIQASWLMIPMRKMLFSLAINHSAMFHSFLCHYAGSYNVHFNTGNKDEALYHAGMARKIVNESLVDPLRALSNETIATVANMASFECSNGSIESMRVHLDGLERMVNMRGGIRSGGFPMIVQRMIAWTDYHCATALLSQPRFPPLNVPETQRPEDYFYSPISPIRDLSRFRRAESAEIKRRTNSLGPLLAGVRDLALLLKELKQRPNLTEDNIWYSDKIYSLQRGLVDVVYCPSTPKPIDRVCAMAALMYSAHCLRDVPLTFQVISRSITRLKETIEQYEEDALPGTDPEDQKRMFWVLGFGGVAAAPWSERDWFVAKFRGACDSLNINDWETAKGVLKSVLWQAELDDAASKLWLEAILGDF